jgi:hypothetical protein
MIGCYSSCYTGKTGADAIVGGGGKQCCEENVRLVEGLVEPVANCG